MTMREKLTERVGKGHLSYSSIKYAAGDMRLWEMYMRGELKKESDALAFGTLYDMLLFERDKAMQVYEVVNEEKLTKDIKSLKPKLTKEYKERLADLKLKAETGGKIVCSLEDWQQAVDMIKRLDMCGLRQSHLTGKFQVKFDTEIDGIPVKGFLDCLGEDFITDSKSCRNISKFRYDVKSWSYDIQAYIYTKVFGIKDYYWVAQEKAYPYYPALVKCSDETLFTGEMKFHDAVERINNWLDKDENAAADYANFSV
jgi:hypothetical protein|tara:strand:+ start:951 stop:1718 length:768 start_codon:yes stop_codon:yes gene_type:complete